MTEQDPQQAPPEPAVQTPEDALEDLELDEVAADDVRGGAMRRLPG